MQPLCLSEVCSLGGAHTISIEKEEHAMLTDFGKILRKLRIDRQEFLRDMAKKLGVSSAYLSAVETGKRKAPESWVDVIIEQYELNSVMASELRLAYEHSTQEVKIPLNNVSATRRDAVLSFAKALNGLDDEKLAKIMAIVTDQGE